MNEINTILPVTNKRISASRTLRLGMSELCPTGLSEQWLLRFCGDIHWSLIAKAMGQNKAIFTDAYGRDVYAAFCATSLSFAPMTDLLAKSVRISSTLYQVNNHQIGSIHKIELAGDEIAKLSMISTFVSHEERKTNRRIVRNRDMPKIHLEEAPNELADIAENARSIAKHGTNPLDRDKVILQVTPCPALDFNAVGLLYFPTFSKLAELAEWKQCRALGQIKHRDVVYLGNLDIAGSLEIIACGNHTSIIREDGCVIAHILTDRHLN